MVKSRVDVEYGTLQATAVLIRGDPIFMGFDKLTGGRGYSWPASRLRWICHWEGAKPAFAKKAFKRGIGGLTGMAIWDIGLSTIAKVLCVGTSNILYSSIFVLDHQQTVSYP